MRWSASPVRLHRALNVITMGFVSSAIKDGIWTKIRVKTALKDVKSAMQPGSAHYAKNLIILSARTKKDVQKIAQKENLETVSQRHA